MDKQKRLVLDDLVEKGRARELIGNLIRTWVGDFERHSFSVDFCIPSDKAQIDVRKQLVDIAKYLPTAEMANIELIGQLEQKDAICIRISGIYIRSTR